MCDKITVIDHQHEENLTHIFGRLGWNVSCIGEPWDGFKIPCLCKAKLAISSFLWVPFLVLFPTSLVFCESKNTHLIWIGS